MKLEKIIIGTLVTLTMVSCANKEVDTSNQPAPEYPAMILKPQTAILESVYPVSMKGQEDIQIRPRIDGFIDAIYVDEGSVVSKGQVLFKINSPQAVQAYTSAQAQVNSAQAQVNTAKLDVDRIRPLAQKGIVSEVQLNTYKNVYETALAGLASANAALTNAKATLSWATVTSPVNGVVGEIPYRTGSLVNSANALTTVANISTMYAHFSLNEKQLIELLNRTEGKSQAEKIKNLPPITLKLSNGTVYPLKGRIETISGSISQTTGTANFRAEFKNDGSLRSGFSGSITIPTTLEDAYVIPQRATFPQQDKILAYKIQGDSVIQTLVKVVNTPDGKQYVVTEGLTEGDKIITGDIATLQNGKKVTPVIK